MTKEKPIKTSNGLAYLLLYLFLIFAAIGILIARGINASNDYVDAFFIVPCILTIIV